MEEPFEGRAPGSEVDLNLDDMLGRLRFVIDHGRPHILVDALACANCIRRSCLRLCPVRAYQWQEGGILLHWERCIECGACLHACDRGAITWSYPRGGYGVSFRLG